MGKGGRREELPDQASWQWIIEPIANEYRLYGNYSKKVSSHAQGLIVRLDFEEEHHKESKPTIYILNITLEPEVRINKNGHTVVDYKKVVRQIDSETAKQLMTSSMSDDLQNRLLRIARQLKNNKELTETQLRLKEVADSLFIKVDTSSL